jgi:hypothetical protein
VRLFFAVLRRESGCLADSFLEFRFRLPQVMEQAGKACVWFALERCGKGFRPAGHASKVCDKRLTRMCERLVRIHGLYSKMPFTALNVGAT